MKRIFVILFVILSTTVFCQKVRLADFEVSECEETNLLLKYRTRIVSQEYFGDTLKIIVAKTAKCCVDFKPSIEVNSDTIGLNYIEMGEECECSCSYLFSYYLIGLNNIEYSFRLQSELVFFSEEKFETFPISYSIFNGDTIGYSDKYGLRQGIFIEKFKTQLLERHYKDGVSYKYALVDSSRRIIRQGKDLRKVLLIEK